MITIQKAVIARAKMCETNLDRVTILFINWSKESVDYAHDALCTVILLYLCFVKIIVSYCFAFWLKDFGVIVLYIKYSGYTSFENMDLKTCDVLSNYFGDFIFVARRLLYTCTYKKCTMVLRYVYYTDINH